MEKRRRKGSKSEVKKAKKAKNPPKGKKVAVIKSNIRLFSASDVMWMVQNDDYRNKTVVKTGIGLDGIHLEMEHGIDSDGDKTYAVHDYDWPSVAITLGFDRAEPVLDQFGEWHVLLYDRRKVNA